MNKPAYEKLVAENLAWLLAQPRTLERDHIEQIVRNSVEMHYPAKEPVSDARHLFEVGHAISPFMTLDNGPDGCCLRMQFASLADGQAMHTALVRFFKEPQP